MNAVTYSPEKAIKHHFVDWIKLFNENPKSAFEHYIWQSKFDDEKTKFVPDDIKKVTVDQKTIRLKWAKQGEEYFFKLNCTITVNSITSEYETWGLLVSESVCKFIPRVEHDWENYANLMNGNTMNQLH